MQEFNISELIPHPRNEEFFDDITGDSWKAFLESISTSGVIEPIVITQDKVIVSGHQRTRACKELGIPTILAEVRIYNSEEQIIKELLETNIRQRGIGNPNPIKLGRCIKELERIYGIRQGSYNEKGDNRIGELKVSTDQNDPKTETELAELLGITRYTLQNYKKLTELIPELEDLVLTGMVAPSTATAIVKYMSPEEQEQFVASLDMTQKITKQKVDEYVSQMKSQETYYINHISKLESTITRLTKELTLFQDDAEKYSKLKSQIDFLTKQRDDLSRQISSATELASLTVRLQKVLEEDLAPIKFKRCMDCLDSSDVAMNNLKEVIAHIEDWVKEMKTYTEGEFIYE